MSIYEGVDKLRCIYYKDVCNITGIFLDNSSWNPLKVKLQDHMLCILLTFKGGQTFTINRRTFLDLNPIKHLEESPKEGGFIYLPKAVNSLDILLGKYFDDNSMSFIYHGSPGVSNFNYGKELHVGALCVT